MGNPPSAGMQAEDVTLIENWGALTSWWIAR